MRDDVKGLVNEQAMQDAWAEFLVSGKPLTYNAIRPLFEVYERKRQHATPAHQNQARRKQMTENNQDLTKAFSGSSEYLSNPSPTGATIYHDQSGEYWLHLPKHIPHHKAVDFIEANKPKEQGEV